MMNHKPDTKMRVGFDLDGVLYNFGDSVQRYLEHIGKGEIWKSGPTKGSYWDFYKDWGWTFPQFKQLCDDGADDGFIFCGPTREGAVEAVNKVKALGHDVIIITDRAFGASPKVSQSNTLLWLAEHGIPYDEIHFSADKTCVPTDMFVEDKLENYDALRLAGVDTYLINRAWNLQPNDYRVRINNVMEYAQLVELKTMYDRVGV